MLTYFIPKRWSQEKRKLSGRQNSRKNFPDKARELWYWRIRDKCAQNLKFSEMYWSFFLFLCCLDSLWIVWTVYGLSGQFMDCLDSFFGSFGQFPVHSDSFWIVQTVFGMYGQFGIDMSWKEQYLPYWVKLSGFCKNPADSNAAVPARFFCLCQKGNSCCRKQPKFTPITRIAMQFRISVWIYTFYVKSVANITQNL